MRKPMKRAMHFDYHNMPELPDLGDDFLAEKFVGMLREAKVKYINFFARCNLGYSYYPTKIGIPHPYLKGRDLFGELLKECHKYDIGVSAYFNASLSHALADLKREWTVVDRDGRILWGDRKENCFRHMCYNTGYGDHLVSEVSELLILYPEVDGIFIDCFSFPKPCYGHECVEEMKAEDIDIEAEGAVAAYNERKKVKMAKRLRAVVPEDKYFFINGTLENGTCFYGRTELDTHAEIECLATGGWGYEYFPTKVAFERNRFATTVFMSGRFHRSWGDFGGLREKAAFEFDAYSALANAVNISIGDHLPPRGLPEKALFDIVKDVYTEVEKTEPWTEQAQYVPEIGIYLSKGRWADDNEAFPLGCGFAAISGAVRMLAELKYQYDVVMQDSDLSRYELLILPDCMTLGGEDKKIISDFIKNGGKIISSGTSGLTNDLTDFALSEWNFRYGATEPWNASYFKAGDKISEGICDMVTATYEPGIALLPKKGNEILAEYWEPYFDQHWDGYQGYYYTPYSKKSDTYAAIVKEGNLIHISFRIFQGYRKYAYPIFRKVIKNCIRKLYSERKIQSNLPIFARASLTEKNQYLLLHVLSYCPEQKGALGIIDEGIKLSRSQFSIACDKEPKKVYTVPKREPIEFSFANNRVEFMLAEIDGNAMIAIEF